MSLYDKALTCENEYDYFKALFYYEECFSEINSDYNDEIDKIDKINTRISFCYFKLNEISKVEESLKKIQKDNFETYYIRANISYYYKKDFNLIEINDFIEKGIQLNPYCNELYYLKGDIILKEENYDSCINYYNDLLQISTIGDLNMNMIEEKNSEINKDKVRYRDIFIKKCGILMKNNKNNEVIKILNSYSNIFQQKFNNIDYYLILSKAYYNIKNFDIANKIYDDLIDGEYSKLYIDYLDEIYLNKAFILLELKLYKEAQLLIEKALKINPYSNDIKALKNEISKKME